MQLSAVSATDTNLSPQVVDNSPSGILKRDGFSDVLVTSTDGATGKLKLNRKLTEGQPKPLTTDQIKKLPDVIEILRALPVAEKGLIIAENLKPLLIPDSSPDINPNDTQTLNLGETSTSIPAFSPTPVTVSITASDTPAVPFPAREISAEQKTANEILAQYNLSGYGITIYLGQSKHEGNKKFVTFTSSPIPKSFDTRSKDEKLSTLELALREIGEALKRISVYQKDKSADSVTLKISSI